MGSVRLKIIALDIDGVLNTRVDYENIREYGRSHPSVLYYDSGDFVNVECLKQLRRIHAETGAVILGTSAWFHDDNSHVGISEFFQIPIVGRSSHNTGGGYWRAWGIDEYIQSTQPLEYVIFDDMIDGYEKFNFGHRLFETKICGLTKEMADDAIAILNGVHNASNNQSPEA